AGNNGSNFALARFNLDGTLDTSFEGTGEETLALGPSNNGAARAVAIQPDGMIVVAGDSGPNGGQVFTLVRRKPCGCADLTFGDAGVVLTGLGGNAQANSVAIAPDTEVCSLRWHHAHSSIDSLCPLCS